MWEGTASQVFKLEMMVGKIFENTGCLASNALYDGLGNGMGLGLGSKNCYHYAGITRREIRALSQLKWYRNGLYMNELHSLALITKLDMPSYL